MAKSTVSRLVFQTDLSAFNIAFNKSELSRHKGTSGLKYYLVVYYLRRWVGYFGEFYMSLNSLLTGCGYSPAARNNPTVNQFKDILASLVVDGYITTNHDVEALKPNDFFMVKLSAEKNLFYATGKRGFITVSLQDVSDMIAADTETSKGTLLATYLAVKQHIFNDQWPIGFPARDTMAEQLGISGKTIEKALGELVQHNFLYKGDQLYVADRDEGKVYFPARSIYALEEKYLESKMCAKVLSDFYGLPVFTQDEIDPRNIRYLKKERGNSS